MVDRVIMGAQKINNRLNCLHHGDNYLLTNLNGNKAEFERLKREYKEITGSAWLPEPLIMESL